jgi:CRP-like cAMP-binding protein
LLPGSPVFRQGEPGDRFYVVTGGRAEVFVEQPDGRELLVDQLGAGQYFGEMALLGRRPRRATVRAAADGPLEAIALDAAMFGRLVAESPGLRDQLQSLIDLRQAHNQVAALADVGHEALRQLAAGAPTRTFAPGETIIRQGELGESIFFVLEGGVEVFVRRGEGEALIDRHGPGRYFGELALLGDRRRTATVRAAGGEWSVAGAESASSDADGRRRGGGASEDAHSAGDGERAVVGARLLELDAAAFEALRRLSGRFAADVAAAAEERAKRVTSDEHSTDLLNPNP